MNAREAIMSGSMCDVRATRSERHNAAPKTIGRPTRAGPKDMSCAMTRLVRSSGLEKAVDEHTVPRAWRIPTAFLEHDGGMIAGSGSLLTPIIGHGE
jgi:hypothetical protein